MKAIILAGGRGTRLYPMTNVISKQLQVIYDKPMIYYPLGTLMGLKIKEFCLISTPEDIGNFEKLLDDGSQWGISITYRVQPNPGGIAQAFLVAEDFVNNEPCGLILGDNLFYGDSYFFKDPLKNFEKGALIYAYRVDNPSAYGVVNFDKNGKPESIEEKPKNPRSHWAVPGLYFYDENVLKYVKELKPSARGELEITDLNRRYMEEGNLKVGLLGRGVAWLDTGTPMDLLNASIFVEIIERRQGMKILCPEEVAFNKGFITEDQFNKLIENLPDSSYKEYLAKVAHSVTEARLLEGLQG